MKIDFYYWNMQCPLNDQMIELLQLYKDDFEIELHDVSNDCELAKSKSMYFPTLTIVSQKMRYFSPLTERFFKILLTGDYPIEKPFIIEHSRKIYHGKITPITKDNIHIAGTCTGKKCDASCFKKSDMLSKLGVDIYGFMHTENNQLLGGVEYIPSTLAPYDIPKSIDYAFITCLYRSSDVYDYKTAPLNALEHYLKGVYRKVYAITDEIGTFPNGDLKLFLDSGYRDEGVVSVEPDYCSLHLVSKDL